MEQVPKNGKVIKKIDEELFETYIRVKIESARKAFENTRKTIHEVMYAQVVDL